MARKSVELLIDTPAEWVNTVLADFDSFLIDHANCEEELQHFGEAYQFMERRGLRFHRDSPDPYVNDLIALARHGRDERFIDRMLISSLVETRGAERFGLIAEALDDSELKAFYSRLWKSEVKHGHLFVHLLLKEVDEDAVYPRLHELAELEAGIVAGLEIRAALH